MTKIKALFNQIKVQLIRINFNKENLTKKIFVLITTANTYIEKNYN